MRTHHNMKRHREYTLYHDYQASLHFAALGNNKMKCLITWVWVSWLQNCARGSQRTVYMRNNLSTDDLNNEALLMVWVHTEQQNFVLVPSVFHANTAANSIASFFAQHTVSHSQQIHIHISRHSFACTPRATWNIITITINGQFNEHALTRNACISAGD